LVGGWLGVGLVVLGPRPPPPTPQPPIPNPQSPKDEINKNIILFEVKNNFILKKYLII